MTEYLKYELKKLITEIKTLDKKSVTVFISVSVMIFISMTIFRPSFYYNNINTNYLEGVYYWMLADGMFMFLIPVLIIKLFFKGRLAEYGISLGDKKFGFITFGLFFTVMLIIVWIVSSSKPFASTYPQGGPQLKYNMTLFILFELSIGIYMLGWEFLWRGYMLFGLKEKLGYYAIFVQMIPFFILHKGKPDIEFFASIIAGLILGIQAYRARSFIYCWLLHWAVMLSIDTISVLRSRFEFYNILPF